MPTTCTAFAGSKRIASGPPERVALAVKAALDANVGHPLLVFDDVSGGMGDFDLRGTSEEILARLAPEKTSDRPDAPARGPGRPKLGVVAREVTLLPRHWDWLNAQPGGASVALRKLVEDASRNPKAQQRARRDAAYRFATALVGNAPGYEEAMRALYAGHGEDFAAHIEGWPPDVRRVLEEMTAEAF